MNPLPATGEGLFFSARAYLPAMRALAPLLFSLLANPAWGEPPRLGLPLDCALGESCWVMNYPDADPGPAARDFTCRARSYDKHDGTDFALRDLATMNRGVPVRAAAPGKVVAARDGEPDGLWIAGKHDDVIRRVRECGNRVSIAHGDGWVTDYCHMRLGSIAVKVGQQVQAGQMLGLVGLSGMTDFPHAHMGVLHFDQGAERGVPVDPFTGAPLAAGCGQVEHSLWAMKLGYDAGELYAAGIGDHIPGNEIKQDAAASAWLSAQSPLLVVWGGMFGAAKGDRVHARLTAPDGAVLFDQAVTVEGDQAWRVTGIGKRRPPEGWPLGAYRGWVRLEREGRPPQQREVAVEVR